jgi:hypothetical protein
MSEVAKNENFIDVQNSNRGIGQQKNYCSRAKNEHGQVQIRSKRLIVVEVL